jgi:hypothetical protein
MLNQGKPVVVGLGATLPPTARGAAAPLITPYGVSGADPMVENVVVPD